MAGSSEWKHLRALMVERQLEGRDICDGRVLNAMRTVARHEFVPAGQQSAAYDDMPLSIGFGQTISQPYIVAYMTQVLALTGDERVLEVGAGCGYQSAILSLLAREVFAIEIVPELVACARGNLERARCANVTVLEGNGYSGLPDKAPFDAILVAAAAPQVPRALIEQLSENGRMIIPVGEMMDAQELCLLQKKQGKVQRDNVMYVRFVPLINEVIDE